MKIAAYFIAFVVLVFCASVIAAPLAPRQCKVFYANNGSGWWCRIDKPGYFMERGPYPFRWMANLAFPIQRWTW